MGILEVVHLTDGKFTINGDTTFVEKGLVSGNISVSYTDIPFPQALALTETIRSFTGLKDESEDGLIYGQSVSQVIHDKSRFKFNSWQLKFLHGLPDGMEEMDVCGSYRKRFKGSEIPNNHIFAEYKWFRENKVQETIPKEADTFPAAAKQSPVATQSSKKPRNTFEKGDIVRYAKGLPGSPYPSGIVVESLEGKSNNYMMVKFGVSTNATRVPKEDYVIVKNERQDS
jgi:hypothetical protein